eukprot:s126_g5.t1
MRRPLRLPAFPCRRAQSPLPSDIARTTHAFGPTPDTNLRWSREQQLGRLEFPWAESRDLPKQIFAHLAHGRPDHPLSVADQEELFRITCETLDLEYETMALIADGQPFRLSLLQALADITEDPDSSLPAMLREGVHTGVFSDIEPSGLWPRAKLQPLGQSGLEVCQGNWKPAEEDPDSVSALLEAEESQGWIQRVEGGLQEAERLWPKGIGVGKLSLVKAEGSSEKLKELAEHFRELVFDRLKDKLPGVFRCIYDAVSFIESFNEGLDSMKQTVASTADATEKTYKEIKYAHDVAASYMDSFKDCSGGGAALQRGLAKVGSAVERMETAAKMAWEEFSDKWHKLSPVSKAAWTTAGAAFLALAALPLEPAVALASLASAMAEALEAAAGLPPLALTSTSAEHAVGRPELLHV